MTSHKEKVLKDLLKSGISAIEALNIMLLDSKEASGFNDEMKDLDRNLQTVRATLFRQLKLMKEELKAEQERLGR